MFRVIVVIGTALIGTVRADESGTGQCCGEVGVLAVLSPKEQISCDNERKIELPEWCCTPPQYPVRVVGGAGELERGEFVVRERRRICSVFRMCVEYHMLVKLEPGYGVTTTDAERQQSCCGQLAELAKPQGLDHRSIPERFREHFWMFAQCQRQKIPVSDSLKPKRRRKKQRRIKVITRKSRKQVIQKQAESREYHTETGEKRCRLANPPEAEWKMSSRRDRFPMPDMCCNEQVSMNNETNLLSFGTRSACKGWQVCRAVTLSFAPHIGKGNTRKSVSTSLNEMWRQKYQDKLYFERQNGRLSPTVRSYEGYILWLKDWMAVSRKQLVDDVPAGSREDYIAAELEKKKIETRDVVEVVKYMPQQICCASSLETLEFMMRIRFETYNTLRRHMKKFQERLRRDNRPPGLYAKAVYAKAEHARRMYLAFVEKSSLEEQIMGQMPVYERCIKPFISVDEATITKMPRAVNDQLSAITQGMELRPSSLERESWKDWIWDTSSRQKGILGDDEGHEATPAKNERRTTDKFFYFEELKRKKKKLQRMKPSALQLQTKLSPQSVLQSQQLLQQVHPALVQGMQEATLPSQSAEGTVMHVKPVVKDAEPVVAKAGNLEDQTGLVEATNSTRADVKYGTVMDAKSVVEEAKPFVKDADSLVVDSGKLEVNYTMPAGVKDSSVENRLAVPKPNKNADRSPDALKPGENPLGQKTQEVRSPFRPVDGIDTVMDAKPVANDAECAVKVAESAFDKSGKEENNAGFVEVNQMACVDVKAASPSVSAEGIGTLMDAKPVEKSSNVEDGAGLVEVIHTTRVDVKATSAENDGPKTGA